MRASCSDKISKRKCLFDSQCKRGGPAFSVVKNLGAAADLGSKTRPTSKTPFGASALFGLSPTPATKIFLKMASLKRSLETDPFASNISSKVYVRSTKSGKVQKIVREVYLREDIPCSSQLCQICVKNVPRNAAGTRKTLSSAILSLSYVLGSLTLAQPRPSCFQRSRQEPRRSPRAIISSRILTPS